MDSDWERFLQYCTTTQQWQSRMQDELQKTMNYFYEHNYDQVSASQEDLSQIDNATDRIRLKSQEFVDEFTNSYYESTADEGDDVDEFEASLNLEGHIMGDEKDWTPEMAEFVRKTREHREQRKSFLICRQFY